MGGDFRTKVVVECAVHVRPTVALLTPRSEWLRCRAEGAVIFGLKRRQAENSAS